MKTLQNIWLGIVSWFSALFANVSHAWNQTTHFAANLTLENWASIVAIVSGLFFIAQVIHDWDRRKKKGSGND